MNNRILEKIKKCMALAGSDNPAEAAAALRQAQKMMEKHGLTASDLRLSEVGEAESKGASQSKSLPNWVVGLRHMIGGVFGTEVINRFWLRFGTYYNVPVFVGLGDRPQAAQYTYEVLFRQISADRRRYLRELDRRLAISTKTRLADLFCEGWVSAVRSKVEDVAISQEDQDLVSLFNEKTYGQLKKVKPRSHGDRIDSRDVEAIRDGIDAGQDAQLFRGVSTRAADQQIGSAG